MLSSGSRAAIGVALVAAPFCVASGQQVSYNRAEQLLDWNTTLITFGDEVRPQWLLDGARFWYRNKTATGAEFVMVDPVRNSRGLLFENTRLAAAMSVANDTSYDPSRLPFRTFKFTNDGKNEHEIEFTANKKRFLCDITSYRCAVHDTLSSEVPYVLSPDKKLEAFVYKYNVYVRPRGGGDSTQLTTDGVRYWSYGLVDPRPSELQRPQPRRPQIRWSPDSKKLIVMRTDERNVGLMSYISYTPQRPKVYSQPYALPGDSIVPIPAFHIIDVTTKNNLAVKLTPTPNRLTVTGSARDSVWNATSDKVYVTWFTRGDKSAYLASVDPATGNVHVIARDSSKTYVEIGPPTSDPISWYVTRDGTDAFWWSERDGWSHLYRLDASGGTSVAQAGAPAAAARTTVANGEVDLSTSKFRSGLLKNQVTSGQWDVGQIEYVDEANKYVYFTARGREPGVPYYARLYRVNYDGCSRQRMATTTSNSRLTGSTSWTATRASRRRR
jgi:hypothetical protein